MKVTKAIIPAAGMGTRFLPATKSLPKEMLPIVDKPTIQYIVEEAVASGIEDILIVTGRGKRAIEDYFDHSPELEYELKLKGKEYISEEIHDISEMARIMYVRQKEPLGLGHAIYCARSFVSNEPFAVLLGDDVAVSQSPALGQLLKVHEKYGCSVIGASRVPKEQVSNYGVIATDDSFESDGSVYKVKSLVEKPPVEQAPSNLVIFGRYIITPRIFDILKHTQPGSGGEIQLTDALLKLLEYEDIYAVDFEGKRYDVGQKLGFLKATVEFALERKDLGSEFRKFIKNLVEENESL